MKKFLLNHILGLLEVGLTRKDIVKKLGISKQNLNYYLGKLQKQGLIVKGKSNEITLTTSKNLTLGVTPNSTKRFLNKRGHAFNIKVTFPSELNLKEKPLVKDFYERNKNNCKITSFGSISFKYKNNTIWINKNSMTYYSKTSHYATDALHSKFFALKEIDNHISYFKQKFSFKGVYTIEIFREHYGLIHNKFAQYLLSQNRKLNVKDKGNKTILWVDDSREDDIGLKEFESNDPIRINKADNYFKELDETNYEVTPKFTLDSIHRLLKGQEFIMNYVGIPNPNNKPNPPISTGDLSIPSYIN